MKVGKPKSKRVPVRLRHKIEKAAAAKQRKDRRAAKKNPEWRTKLKKDPGVPRLWPYREKLMNEIEEQRREKREEEEERKRKRDEGVMDVDEQQDVEDLEKMQEDDGFDVDVDDTVDPMAALLASAKARAAEFNGVDDSMIDEEEEDDDEEDGNMSLEMKEHSRKQFNKIFTVVLAQSDILLYVLDARDPEGTRSRAIEEQILTANEGRKRLIFVLNKIDLIPPAALKGWLTHLRRSFPTIPLRASGPAGGAKTFEHKGLGVKNTSEALFKTLKSFAESKKMKRAVVVGVIGFPNVGKSSVINSLSMRTGGQMGRGAACKVGAEAGVTTGVKEIKVDGSLKIVDCPGIVFPSAAKEKKIAKEEEKARLVLLNAIPHREIDDPISAVKLLVKRLSTSEALMQQLYDLYDLKPLMQTAEGDILTDFLVQVARRRGRLGRGGVPNLHSAAEAVLTDWRDGRIQGWLEPPNVKSNDEKVVVKEWAEEFKLDGLWGDSELPEDDMMD